MSLTLCIVVLASVMIGVVVFLTVYRPWHLRWGATSDEAAAHLLGDELLGDVPFHATRAITVDALPEEVWPWLVQVGFGRAGWYSYDRLDNQGRPSASRIIPELQTIAIGDWVPMASTVNEQTAFRVASFETARTLLWTKPDSTWLWALRPQADGRTRIVARLRCRHEPSTLLGFAGMLLMELGDFPMIRKMLLNIKRRVERSSAARRIGTLGQHAPSTRDVGTHRPGAAMAQ